MTKILLAGCAALATAEQEANTAHALAFDPVRSPDPAKAKAEMEQTAFARDRLKGSLAAAAAAPPANGRAGTGRTLECHR